MQWLAEHLSHGLPLMLIVLLVLTIAYRYYSAFIAAKVLALDDTRVTPAHTLRDGHNYDPTNRWVLFGHHFAAISGAGPLIGPVLAAQFGYLPGLLWILIGVCLGGAVQDFVVLVFSTRREGKSLARIAYDEVGPATGTAATVGILFVLVIALAGLGKVVVKALGGEKVTFPAGTQFVAPEHSVIAAYNRYDNVLVYRVKPGCRIVYANGAAVEVSQEFDLKVTALHGLSAIDVAVQVPGKLPGQSLLIGEDVAANRVIPGSSWGTLTIALTIPIALLVGWYMTRVRKGRVLEASIIGGVLTLGAVWLGGYVQDPANDLEKLRDMFNLQESQISLSMAIYGFIASVLPVWVLLCPRDYLSSFLKIGTVALLVLGVIIANPALQAPAINSVFLLGGPTVKGAIFPFVFITIMCGAISGFHSLVSSGTTPKMLDKESHARMIGYGAMLMEGLVGLVALIAAASLPMAHYYHMNTSWKDLPQYQQQIVKLSENDQARTTLGQMEHQVGETLEGRTGGAVTLAVGMAEIFDEAARKILGTASSGVEWMESMTKYWYHFAIMFEALFILTTIDAGTRVGRFLLQETMGKWIHPKLGQTHWWPSAILATGLMVCGWWYFINSNSMEAIWPMFGIANQMLAVIALAVSTVVLVRSGKRRYAWVTLGPLVFVTITTTSAAAVMVTRYAREIQAQRNVFNNSVSASLIVVIVLCAAVVMGGAVARIRQEKSRAEV